MVRAVREPLFPLTNASPYRFVITPFTSSSVCSNAMFIKPSRHDRIPVEMNERETRQSVIRSRLRKVPIDVGDEQQRDMNKGRHTLIVHPRDQAHDYAFANDTFEEVRW